MQDRSDWIGAVPTRSDSFDALTVQACSPAGGSWSGPFRALADDGHDWFVKGLDTIAGDQQASLAIERVVALVGAAIGASVCSTSLIRIPPEIAGYEVRPGVSLSAGLAHASRALAHAEEIRPNLSYRNQDDNGRRHVGAYALFDLCFGADQQWLTDLDDDRALYSHDHGLYLPPHSGALDSASLDSMVDQPHPLPDDPSGLSASAVDEMADRLDNLTANDLVEIVGSVPSSWPVSDTDLETVGWFLFRRAKPTAERLRELV